MRMRGAPTNGTNRLSASLPAAALAILALALTGCQNSTSVQQNICDWFALQTSVAQSLNDYWGGERFRITPTKGAAYPIGTVFDAGSPSPLTKRCQMLGEAQQDVPVTPFPLFTTGTTFALNATAPREWTAAIGLAETKAGITHRDALEFSLLELKQVFVYEDALRHVLVDQACLGSLPEMVGQEQIIVRGYIRCRYCVSSVKKWEANAKISTVQQDGLAISFDRDSGSFRIEQQAPFEWFTIFTSIGARRTVRELDSTSRELIAKMLEAYSLTPEKTAAFLHENPGAALSMEPGNKGKDLEKLRAWQEDGKVEIVALEFSKPDETAVTCIAAPPRPASRSRRATTR